jgi:hypothetical protein
MIDRLILRMVDGVAVATSLARGWARTGTIKF